MTYMNTEIETHFSVLMMLDESTLEDLLREVKGTGKTITVGVVIESKDAKYKTFSNSRVSIDRLTICGDASKRTKPPAP